MALHLEARKYVMGIDPGVSGGIAFWDNDGVRAHKMPATLADLWALIHDNCYRISTVAYLEKVASMSGEGVRSVFTFGQNFGALRMALTAAGIPFFSVPPQTWCKKMGLKKKKTETNTEWKNRHKALAQELFPHLKITHYTADALLIMEYGRRINA